MKKITSLLTTTLVAVSSVFAQTTIVDFETLPCQNAAWEGTTDIVVNPLSAGINTSDSVCLYTTPVGKAWGNCAVVIFDTPITYSELQKIDMAVLAPSATQMFVKLENNTLDNEEQPTAWATPIASTDWQTISLGFESANAIDSLATYDKLGIFFNVNDATGNEDWYYDNIVAYGGVDSIAPVLPEEPAAPNNLQVAAITDTSFTLTWEVDPLATSTNIFLEDQFVEGSNTYIATVAQGVTTYTYQGTYGDITITKDGTYVARVQSLPDADNSAYTQLRVIMNAPEGEELAYDENFWIFLCFGQSNMEGSAPIEAEDLVADDRFKVLQSLDCTSLMRSKDLWYDAVPPLTQCNSQLSPADYFGKELIENLPDSITVGVLNVSVGGCDIRLFDKDLYHNYDSTYNEEWYYEKIVSYGGNPYQHLINLAKKAQESGVVKGILLHQGEANQDDAQWPNYVSKVYGDMLSDLSLDSDAVHLYAGQLVDAEQDGTCASMNVIIDKLPTVVSTAHVISSKDCTVLPDFTHFDSEGVRLLGKRYADAVLAQLGGDPTGLDDNTTCKGSALEQNYPNPFSDNTSISFNLPNKAYVSLKVYNTQGVEVAELAGGEYALGTHVVEFSQAHQASGVYLYTLQTKDFYVTKRMMVKAE